jgi:hypothetical protein
MFTFVATLLLIFVLYIIFNRVYIYLKFLRDISSTNSKVLKGQPLNFGLGQLKGLRIPGNQFKYLTQEAHDMNEPIFYSTELLNPGNKEFHSKLLQQFKWLIQRLTSTF